MHTDQLTTVLLCHFGGPTKAEEIETFLKRLFGDPAILRMPIGSWLRSKLASSIARKRAPKVLEEYRSIGFSPINASTNAQAEHLQRLLRVRRPASRVLVVNRYTPPFAEEVLKELDITREKLFLLSLYPHFSTTSTGSSYMQLDALCQKRHRLPALPATRVLAWWDNPTYLQYSFSFLRAILEKLLRHDAPPMRTTFLFSAHSIPRRFVDAGDPYRRHIEGHFNALRDLCVDWLPSEVRANFDWQLSFQSRVGPVEWLKPYTDELIPKLGRENGGRLVIVPISFVSDHLETLFEMDVTYRNLALTNGFTEFERVALPNDDPGLAACLRDVLVEHGF